MDKTIYEKRAQDIDTLLSRLYADLDGTPLNDEDGEARELLRRIEGISRLETENAKILLESERNELKDRELAAADVVSDEKNKVETEQNRLRERELDIREVEAGIHRDEITAKLQGDKEKLKVEEDAVKARLGGEALKVLSTVVGCAGTVIALKAAMTFEKADEGGIIPSKFVSMIFRMVK